MLRRILRAVRERRLGFRMSEVMRGEHRFEPGCGPEGALPMVFRATWGTDDLAAFLDPRSEGFLCADLEGTVTAEGLCTGAPCRGTLELRYLTEHLIRYRFRFEAGGRWLQFVGLKVNIQVWNLPVSHTTCFGTITEEESGRLISRSTTLFGWRQIPRFLASLRVGPPRRQRLQTG